MTKHMRDFESKWPIDIPTYGRALQIVKELKTHGMLKNKFLWEIPTEPQGEDMYYLSDSDEEMT